MIEPNTEKRLTTAIKLAMEEVGSRDPGAIVAHIIREPFYSKFVSSEEQLAEYIVSVGLKVVVDGAFFRNSHEHDDNSDKPPFTDDFGGLCPRCHRNDGILNVRKTHWTVCHTHKACWSIGTNLFSSWRNETEEDWDMNYKLLSTYDVVEPFCYARTA